MQRAAARISVPSTKRLFGPCSTHPRWRAWVPVIFCRLQTSQTLFSKFGPCCFETEQPSPWPNATPGHMGHRPGQDMGLMQRPWNCTRLAGQWQPATQGFWHGPISFQLSQVLVQPGPQVSYTAPCLHWVADGRKEKVKTCRKTRENIIRNIYQL